MFPLPSTHLFVSSPGSPGRDAWCGWLRVPLVVFFLLGVVGVFAGRSFVLTVFAIRLPPRRPAYQRALFLPRSGKWQKWSTDQRHQHRLGPCQKRRAPRPRPAHLNQYLHFTQISQGILATDLPPNPVVRVVGRRMRILACDDFMEKTGNQLSPGRVAVLLLLKETTGRTISFYIVCVFEVSSAVDSQNHIPHR